MNRLITKNIPKFLVPWCGRELQSSKGFPGKEKGEESLLLRSGDSLFKDLLPTVPRATTTLLLHL